MDSLGSLALTMDPDSIPFPLLFAEEIPPSQDTHSGFDITEKLAELTLPAGPTGKKDKVLILSSRRDVHADRVALELVRRGTPVCRFHTEELLESCLLTVSLGARPSVPLATLRLPSCDLLLEEVRSVWLRRPELPTYGGGYDHPVSATADFVARETEAALFGMVGLLDDAFWVSHPTQLKASDNKLVNLKLAQSLGLQIPRTLVTNDAAQAKAFHDSCGGQVIVKAFCGSPRPADGEGFALFASPVLPEHLDKLHLVQHAPCLFQEYVPKDVELRVTIVGRQIFAAEIHSQRSARSRHDWRRYDFSNTPYYPTTLPADVEQGCLRLLAHYDLSFGAIDMIRRPDGAYVFLELNANGQWLWIQDLTGMPIAEAISELLTQGSTDYAKA